MKRFVEGIARQQATLFPECLEDWIDGNNPVRVIDAFVEKLDLLRLGFDGAVAEAGAAASRPKPASHATTPRDGRTSLRHSQDANGSDALPDETLTQSR